jgi:hypothetical protein
MQFLVEADLVQRVDGRDPIISLRGADLSDADLSGAILRDANLRDADLGGFARGVANELEQEAETLEGATMPNGQKYEDWLKSKNREEDV